MLAKQFFAGFFTTLAFVAVVLAGLFAIFVLIDSGGVEGDTGPARRRERRSLAGDRLRRWCAASRARAPPCRS